MYIAHRLLDSTVLSILRPQVRILNSPKSKVAPVFRNYYAMILTLKALLLWFVPFWSSLACFGRKKCLLSWPLWVCNVVSSSHPRQRAQQRSFFQSNFQSFSFRVDRSSFPDSVTAKRNYSPTPPHRGVDVIKRFLGCRRSSVDSFAPSILPPRVRFPSTPSMLFQFQFEFKL